MKKPPVPSNEKERMKLLQAYEVLDTLPEKDFDDITRIASHICQKPIALISLVDENRQWFKSHHGLDATETPRDYAFCAHAINHPNEIMVVNDAQQDERFQGNPLVEGEPHVIFYAGAPLVSADGLVMGTLCVIDHQPGDLGEAQQHALQSLARQVMVQLELRRKVKELNASQKALEESNQALEDFAHVVSHDLQSPLRNISLLLDWLENDLGDKLDKVGKQYISMLKERSGTLSSLVKGVLDYSLVQNHLAEKKEVVNLKDVFQETCNILGYPFKNIDVQQHIHVEKYYCNPAIFQQILLNLLSNALKYNDKLHGKIHVNMVKEKGLLHVIVRDNGPGIPDEAKEKIFNMFHTLGTVDRYGNKGNGIGLHTVKKLVDKMEGEIAVESEGGKGATFKITLPIH